MTSLEIKNKLIQQFGGEWKVYKVRNSNPPAFKAISSMNTLFVRQYILEIIQGSEFVANNFDVLSDSEFAISINSQNEFQEDYIVLDESNWRKLIEWILRQPSEPPLTAREQATQPTIQPFTQTFRGGLNQVLSDYISPQSDPYPIREESLRTLDNSLFSPWGIETVQMTPNDNICPLCYGYTDTEELEGINVENVPNFNNFKRVCANCFRRNYRECNNTECGKNTYVAFGFVTRAGEFFCQECSDDFVVCCDNCGGSYNKTTTTYSNIRGELYCENCTGHIYTCGGCSQLEIMTRGGFCDVCDKKYCRTCWQEHGCNVNAYRDGNRPKFYSGNKEKSMLTVDRFVGVEIEAEKGNQTGLKTKLPTGVGMTADGSLDRNTGVELQTPPATFDKLENFVKKSTEALKEKGYKGTRQCGLHVHFDARDFMNDEKKIVQVIKTFYAVEDLLYSMLPPSRWNGRFCGRLSNSYLYKNFKKSSKKEEIEKEWYKEENYDRVQSLKRQKYGESRYFGLNIHSIFFRGTVELRYHSGTVEENKILSWIELTSKILDYAINKYKEPEITKLFDMATSSEKLNYFANVMGIEYWLKDYIIKRTQKFNKNYTVKFNKGKVIRSVERKGLNKIRRIMEKAYLTEYPKQLAKAKIEQQGRSGYSRKQIEELAKARTYDKLQNTLPKEYFSLPVDGGFAKKEEVDTIVNWVEQGIQMQSAGGEGSDEAGL